MYLIPSGGDGDFSPQARSLVKVILLIVQALLFLFLLLLAFFVHREFGWRTFSYVAAAQIPLNAHRAWTKSRTLLEWLLVGDAAHLLGLALIWPQVTGPPPPPPPPPPPHLHLTSSTTSTPQIPDVLPRDLLIPFFLVLAVDGAWLGLTFLSFGSRRHFLILLKWLPTHAALGRPPESAPDEDEIFCEAVWGPAVFTLLLLLGLLLPAAAAYGASSVAMEAVAFVADGMPAFVLFSFAIVLLRLAALLSLAFVWQFRSPLHEYFTKGRRNHGDLHHLPAFVQRHVRRDVDEEALRFCCVGMKMTILKESRSAGLGSGRSRVGGARKYERFFQLSQDLSTIRWSWEDFLLIDEIIHIRYTPSKPLNFTVIYSHSASQQADLSLTLVCKKPRQAQQWYMALNLLRRAYADEWGVATSELTRLKAAFKVASGASGKDTLSLAQQQDFFQCLNRYIAKDEILKEHKRVEKAEDAAQVAQCPPPLPPPRPAPLTPPARPALSLPQPKAHRVVTPRPTPCPDLPPPFPRD